MVQSVRLGDLKMVLKEAREALMRLDAERLEDIAFSCAMPVRGTDSGCGEPMDCMDVESEEARREMEIFMRVLHATKANLQVMRRLREMRASKLEYGPELIAGHTVAEDEDGNN